MIESGLANRDRGKVPGALGVGNAAVSWGRGVAGQKRGICWTGIH